MTVKIRAILFMTGLGGYQVGSSALKYKKKGRSLDHPFSLYISAYCTSNFCVTTAFELIAFTVYTPFDSLLTSIGILAVPGVVWNC